MIPDCVISEQSERCCRIVDGVFVVGMAHFTGTANTPRRRYTLDIRSYLLSVWHISPAPPIRHDAGTRSTFDRICQIAIAVAVKKRAWEPNGTNLSFITETMPQRVENRVNLA